MQGEFQQALRGLESAIENTGSSASPGDRALALSQAGSLHLKLGNLPQAISLSQRSLRRFEESYGVGCQQSTVPLTNLALAWAAQRNFRKAQSAIEQVLEIRAAASLQDDPAISNTVINLANIHLARGRLLDADSCARRAIRTLEANPAAWPIALASSYNVLAVTQMRRGALREALADLRKALDIVERYVGYDHPDAIGYVLNLGSLHLRLREWSGAEVAVKEALAITERRLGDHHPLRAEALLLLADVYKATGRRTDAKNARQRAHEIRASGPNYPANALVSIDDLMQRR